MKITDMKETEARKKSAAKVDAVAVVMTVDGEKHSELVGDPALSPKITIISAEEELVDPQYARKMSVQ